jgi:hypothetical protein
MVLGNLLEKGWDGLNITRVQDIVVGANLLGCCQQLRLGPATDDDLLSL